MTTYVLGGGCFWCLDAVFRNIRGVVDVISGYSGGETNNPTYYQVANGTTGHAEVVQVTFDESIIPADTLLDIFFTLHNPTTLNRQGADVGTQYRSVMFYADNTQKTKFESAIERASTIWDNPIVTQLEQLTTFYAAEPEHQDYFAKNPTNGYCSIVITPKINKVRAKFKQYFTIH